PCSIVSSVAQRLSPSLRRARSTASRKRLNKSTRNSLRRGSTTSEKTSRFGPDEARLDSARLRRRRPLPHARCRDRGKSVSACDPLGTFLWPTGSNLALVVHRHVPYARKDALLGPISTA